jgi:hypothetical protein
MVFPGDALDFAGLERRDRPTQNMRIIDVKDLGSIEETMPGAQRENTGLVGLVLSITHGLGNEGITEISQRPRSGPGQNGVTRMRLDPRTKKNYDRIVLLADVGSNKGRCFAVILENNNKSLTFFRTGIKNQLGVGHLFFIKEPGLVENSLGSSESVLVIANYAAVLSVGNLVSTAIAQVPFQYPPAGATGYFCYHGISVTLSLASVFDDSCKGTFCDRQGDNVNRKACGCFTKAQSNSCVIQAQLQVVIAAFHDGEEQHPEQLLFIPCYRSKWTTDLFVSEKAIKFAFENTQPEEPALRNAILQCVTHINNNGGWSLIGWIRTGVTADASDVGNISGLAQENMASVSTKPDVSYLFPTDPAVVNTVEYRNMRYTRTAAGPPAVDNAAAGNVDINAAAGAAAFAAAVGNAWNGCAAATDADTRKQNVWR